MAGAAALHAAQELPVPAVRAARGGDRQYGDAGQVAARLRPRPTGEAGGASGDCLELRTGSHRQYGSHRQVAGAAVEGCPGAACFQDQRHLPHPAYRADHWRGSWWHYRLHDVSTATASTVLSAWAVGFEPPHAPVAYTQHVTTGIVVSFERVRRTVCRAQTDDGSVTQVEQGDVWVTQAEATSEYCIPAFEYAAFQPDAFQTCATDEQTDQWTTQAEADDPWSEQQQEPGSSCCED